MTNIPGVESPTAPCAWESGELGFSAEHAKPVSKEHQAAVDDALELQMISIRLPKSLISDLKLIAEKEGLGYQPLMRRVLMRFTAAEFRNMAHDKLVPTLADRGDAKEPCEEDEDPPLRRAAAR